MIGHADIAICTCADCPKLRPGMLVAVCNVCSGARPAERNEVMGTKENDNAKQLSPIEREVKAMKAIGNALDSLEGRSQKLVLAYMVDKYIGHEAAAQVWDAARGDS